MENIKILFVDDEKNVLKSIERLFIDDDYEIFTANSGSEGIEILEEEKDICLVISDYKMPGMNGVDFLKKVCKKWPDTVRIIFSGYADTVAVVEAINEGQIYKFIPKPWNDDELKTIISNSVEWHSLQIKNSQLTMELRVKNKELIELNNNLEKLVTERTSELLFQNKVLTVSQNILDALPVGVVGIDEDGIIVQCNREFRETNAVSSGQSAIGRDRNDIFSEEINNFIDKVLLEKKVFGNFTINDIIYNIRGSLISSSDNQYGIILVFIEE